MSDERRDARAEAAAAKARAKAMRPWYKKKRFLIPLALVVLVVIGVAAGGGDEAEDVATSADDAVEGASEGVRSESQNEDNPPQDDVRIETCEVEPTIDIPQAGGTVHNNSSERSNYLIHVDFLQGSRRVAQGIGAENEVQPNQDVTFEVTGDKQVQGAVTCELTRVERFAS